jgi:hypothetical protein
MATALASAEPGPRRWRLRLPERLPNLKGKWLTLYIIVWAITLPVALAGAVRGTYIFLTIVPMWSPYGVATTDTPEGLRIDSVMSAEARAKGIRAGDYVVAIDSWTLPSSGGRAAARTRVIKPDGAATDFRFRRPSGEIYEASLVRSMAFDRQRFQEAGLSWPVARSINAVGTLMLPILFIGAAVLLFIRRRREAVPALLSIAFLIFGGMVNGADLSGVGAGALALVSTIGNVCLFIALLVFPSGRFEPRWTAVAALLIPIIALFDPQGAAGSVVGGAITLSILAALISRYRRVGEGAERLQLRWAFLGLVIGIVFFTVSIAGNAAVTGWQAEDPRWIAWEYALFQVFGIWGLGVMALGLIVSILRYRLYDADTVIGRSAAYGLLTLGFVALFAGSQKIIELLGQEYLGQNLGGLAGGIGAALAAVAVAPMHNRAQRWAERRFQKGLYRLRHGLPALVGDLRETAGLEQIAGATLDSLVDGLRTSRAALLAGDELIDAREISSNDVKKWWRAWTPQAHAGIDANRSDPLFPIRVPLEAEGHGRVGWLLLGARPDGSLFGKTECDAIEEIAEPVARAIEVALRRQEREQQLEIRFQSIERVVANLSKKIGPRENP